MAEDVCTAGVDADGRLEVGQRLKNRSHAEATTGGCKDDEELSDRGTERVSERMTGRHSEKLIVRESESELTEAL
eukprot:6180543-Pleurochrysis_carterae.AAC.6